MIELLRDTYSPNAKNKSLKAAKVIKNNPHKIVVKLRRSHAETGCEYLSILFQVYHS